MIRPIMIILASFAAGILANGSLGPNYKVSAPPLLSIILILFVISLIALIKRSVSARFFIYPCFFLLGALFILPSLTSDFTANHISGFTNTKPGPFGANFSGVLLKTPEVSNGQGRLYVDLKKFYPPGREPQDVTGRVRLRVSSRSGIAPGGALSGLLRGDSFRFLATLSPPRTLTTRAVLTTSGG